MLQLHSQLDESWMKLGPHPGMQEHWHVVGFWNMPAWGHPVPQLHVQVIGFWIRPVPHGLQAVVVLQVEQAVVLQAAEAAFAVS